MSAVVDDATSKLLQIKPVQALGGPKNDNETLHRFRRLVLSSQHWNVLKIERFASNSSLEIS